MHVKITITNAHRRDMQDRFASFMRARFIAERHPDPAGTRTCQYNGLNEDDLINAVGTFIANELENIT